MGLLHKILRNLISEQVSIRDMVLILETLSDVAEEIKDADTLTEYVRQALGRSIVKPLLDEEETLKVLTLDPAIEEVIIDGISHNEADAAASVAIDIGTARSIISATATAINNSVIDKQPIVLCSSLIRRHFKKLTEQYLPNLVVLAYNEIPSGINVQQLGTVSLQLQEGNVQK